MAAYMSPALDLVYFMAASSTRDLREQYLHILTLYHTIFIATVERLGSTVHFTYEEFEEDFKKSCLHGLNFALSALTSVSAEKDKDIMDHKANAETISKEEEEERQENTKEVMKQIKKGFSSNDTLGERIRDLLDFCMENG